VAQWRLSQRYYLSQQKFEPKAVYTFAAPRAGDVTFEGGYDAKHLNTWRYENRFDIVPHVAPNEEDSEIVAKVFTNAFREGRDHYRCVGHLMYINWSGQLTASYADLNAERNGHFVDALQREPNQIAQLILDAHSSAKGDGYGQAICQEP
jgi:hypothetical protein